MSFAKDMYIDWDLLSTDSYTMVIKSWYCSQNAPSTYWAVHQWSNGYAGFQHNVYENNVAKKEIILAIWDDGTNITTVEYKSDLANPNDINFIEDGTGKHIITDINWQDETWYSMAVGVKYDSSNNYTYYAQWVTLEGNEDWQLYSIIGLPDGNRTLNKSSVFQEDYASNNVLRECRISNAYGRLSNQSGTWQLWSKGTIKSYDPNTHVWNNDNDCGFSIGTYTNGKYISLKSGNNAGTCYPSLPHDFNLEISGSWPPSHPIFPHYIKSCYSGKYINPKFNNNKVVQLSTRYWWKIFRADSEYVYIVTPDQTKAIATNGTNDGDDLVLKTFNANDETQKWYYHFEIDPITSEKRYYICPKNALLKCMDIEGPSYDDDTPIQLWSKNTSTQQFKWNIF